MRLIDADLLKEEINSSLNTGRETFSPEIICDAVDNPSFTVTGKDRFCIMPLRAFCAKDFGKNVFFTRKEARKKMEEIKKND